MGPLQRIKRRSLTGSLKKGWQSVKRWPLRRGTKRRALSLNGRLPKGKALAFEARWSAERWLAFKSNNGPMAAKRRALLFEKMGLQRQLEKQGETRSPLQGGSKAPGAGSDVPFHMQSSPTRSQEDTLDCLMGLLCPPLQMLA